MQLQAHVLLTPFQVKPSPPYQPRADLPPLYAEGSDNQTHSIEEERYNDLEKIRRSLKYWRCKEYNQWVIYIFAVLQSLPQVPRTRLLPDYRGILREKGALKTRVTWQ